MQDSTVKVSILNIALISEAFHIFFVKNAQKIYIIEQGASWIWRTLYFMNHSK